MWKGIKIKDIILFVNLPFVHQRGMENWIFVGG
jgi:hypothetical protein